MATGIWPRTQPRTTDSHAEQRVYEALKRQLPSSWSAWHSLRIRTTRGMEGEGDFVLAIPERGFLVLEVKGGQMEMRDGRWYQNGEPMEQAPREQALGYAKKLLVRLKELGCPSVPFGVLTLFPDTAFSAAPGQDDLNSLTLGAQDVPWLIESIRAKLDQVFPEGYLLPKQNWQALLHRLWGETWVPKLKLGHKAKVDAEDRLMLDREQLRLIDSLAANPLLLVEGVAGSGKTILARESALSMAREGKRVLYLCYTDALAQWLRHSLDEAGIEVFTVPRYAAHLLQQAGQLETIPATPEFWFQVSLQAAADALPETEALHPEVIILDEAQDLTENDWALVEELARERICWIFHDPAQGFWQERTLPEWTGARASFRLSTCYRCPPAVLELSRMLRGDAHNAELLEKAREAGIVRMIAAPSESAVMAKLENEITKLRSEGFAPEDIAVISLRGQTAAGGIGRCDKIGGIPVVRADSSEMEHQVVADTFLRFKGLERPAIIVTDLRLVKDRADVRMHIALTRATDVVRVVGFALEEGEGLFQGMDQG